MTILKDLKDEQQAIATSLIPWDKYRRDIARYVLPQTEHNEYLLSSNQGTAAAINSIAAGPVASERSADIYDMTSIWGIERLTAGLLSLKTPETSNWHDLMVDDEFDDYDLEYQEELALERARNYLFKIRLNPASGFWPAHKSAMRSMCAFGDGWMMVPEEMGKKTPWGYMYMQLPELFPKTDDRGNTNMMYRPFRLSAYQIVSKFGPERAGSKMTERANDVKKRHDMVMVMHGVRPRESDKRGAKAGVAGGDFESHYCLPDDDVHLGESGYYEFPYIRYAWSDTGTSSQCEGPVAMALGEIKSLQEMSKQEIMAGASMLRPPIATAGRNFQRMNFNPGQNNPGLISPDGKQLFAPLNQGARPDFARAIIEAKQNNVKEMLYVNLWQTLVQERDTTATEALIRAQEKGELLGPVGISLNRGLSQMVDREVSIMDRKGAFREGSPLAMPESLADMEVAPRFTSPLDRLRSMSELVGMQRLAAFAGELAEVTQRPEVTQRLDTDNMLEKAQDILGAPVDSLVDKEEHAEAKGEKGQLDQVAQMLELAKSGGDALGAVGGGAAALAQGAAANEQLQKTAGAPLPLGGNQ